MLISKALRSARVNEASHTRLCTYGMSHPAFTPQPQNVNELWPVVISRPA